MVYPRAPGRRAELVLPVCAHPTTHKQAGDGQQTSARRQDALLGVCSIFQDQALQPCAFKICLIVMLHLHKEPWGFLVSSEEAGTGSNNVWDAAGGADSRIVVPPHTAQAQISPDPIARRTWPGRVIQVRRGG